MERILSWKKRVSELISETEVNDYAVHKVFEPYGFEIQSTGETCFRRKELKGLFTDCKCAAAKGECYLCNGTLVY